MSMSCCMCVSLAMTHVRWKHCHSGHQSTEYTRSVVQCVGGLQAWPINMCSSAKTLETRQAKTTPQNETQHRIEETRPKFPHTNGRAAYSPQTHDVFF